MAVLGEPSSSFIFLQIGRNSSCAHILLISKSRGFRVGRRRSCNTSSCGPAPSPHVTLIVVQIGTPVELKVLALTCSSMPLSEVAIPRLDTLSKHDKMNFTILVGGLL